MTTAPGRIGEHAEQAVAAHLAERGLSLLERNFRCRAGEIDLVLLHGDVLVFVEVRFRQSERFGGALGSVDRRKQRRLLRAAQAYVSHRGVAQLTPMRFDVVAVSGDSALTYDFEWIKDAFQFD